MEWRAGAATGIGLGLRQSGKWDEDDERSKESGHGM